MVQTRGEGSLSSDAVFLKLESLQPTGSFKVRGAFNSLLGLSEIQSAQGVITFSTGNHGRAVAYAAKQLRKKAVVCLSSHVPLYRRQAIERLDAELIVHGSSQDEAELRYLLERDTRSLVPVAPFDDAAVIAGQGTIGLELLADQPNLDTVLIPTSGGGLLAGIGVAVKKLRPTVRVVAVSVECSPVLQESVRAKQIVQLPERDSIADALLGGIGAENRYTLRAAQAFVDEFVTVSDVEIKAAMRAAFEQLGLVVEGAGAVGLALLLRGGAVVRGNAIAIIVTGRNVDPERHRQAIGLSQLAST